MADREIGFVIYEGPSSLDQAVDIAVIVTNVRGYRVTACSNRKTQDIAQTFILPINLSPAIVAWTPGASYSVCGDCPLQAHYHSGGRTRLCYVNMAPVVKVWMAYREGRYVQTTPSCVNRALRTYRKFHEGEQGIRGGAWGDPAAVPLMVWRHLMNEVDYRPMYTHQWRNLDPKTWGHWAMASVETKDDAAIAQAMGWRTFRVMSLSNPSLLPTEIMCPYMTPLQITCDRCGLCNGVRKNTLRPVKSIAVPVHGPARTMMEKVLAGNASK